MPCITRTSSGHNHGFSSMSYPSSTAFWFQAASIARSSLRAGMTNGGRLLRSPFPENLRKTGTAIAAVMMNR